MITSHRLRLSEATQALGRPGIVGLALLAFSSSFVSSTVWPSWRELEAQRAVAVAAQRATREATAKAVLRGGSPSDELRSFYDVFPPQSAAPELLAKLYAMAAAKKLVLARGEYGLYIDAPTGLVQYRVAFPIRGGYRRIREFIGGALQEVPALALDEVTFERTRIADHNVDAHVRFTLYLRAST